MDADDTARAPMAKAILQSKELPWPMEIGSRGLVVLFPQPVNQKVEAVLARNGLSAKDHTTTPLTAEDINDVQGAAPNRTAPAKYSSANPAGINDLKIT